jgi:hypothetical protein
MVRVRASLMAACLTVTGMLVAGAPAAGQLQAPRPELMTGPPSPPGGDPQTNLAPGHRSAAPVPTLATPASPASDPSPAALPQAPLAGPAHPHHRAMLSRAPRSPAAEDLNHVEMEKLRQARPDIAPPAGSSAASAPSTARDPARLNATTSPADALNRGEIAGARAERGADDDSYSAPVTVRP